MAARIRRVAQHTARAAHVNTLLPRVRTARKKAFPDCDLNCEAFGRAYFVGQKQHIDCARPEVHDGVYGSFLEVVLVDPNGRLPAKPVRAITSMYNLTACHHREYVSSAAERQLRHSHLKQLRASNTLGVTAGFILCT